MNSEEKARAEKVLGHLCIGAEIEGIRFGAIPQLLIADRREASSRFGGQVYLNLGSTWQVYAQRPTSFPEGEDAIEDLEDDAALAVLCGLRSTAIADIELAADAPDLIITFANGRIFFLNGRHESYETWQCGVAGFMARWLVVACPGNSLAIWAPDDWQ